MESRLGMSRRGLRLPKIVPLTSFCHIASSNRLMAESVWVIGATAVTTHVPPLPVIVMAPAIRSPYITPGVMITRSAIWPHVRSCTIGMASSIEATVWVAPNSMAFSRLNSTGSTAMIRRAPAIRAPCGVGGEVPRGAAPPGAVQGFHADAADADDPDRVPGLGLRPLHRGAPAGGHAARDEAHGRHRQVRLDLDHRRLGHHGVLAER